MVDTFKNSGYWAIILGGSSGLGLATAKELAQQGMHLCIVHRDRRTEMQRLTQEFDQLKANGSQVLHFNLDAMLAQNQEAIITELKQAMGPDDSVRTIIHSIAKGHVKPLTGEGGLTLEDYQITINAMALSLVSWVTQVFNADLFSQDARILSFTSEGNSKAWKHYAAVSAAKVSLEAITRSIALEYAPYGIRANCIQAGVTNTPSLRMIPNVDSLLELARKRNPHNRTTTPQDVAQVVLLLCTDQAAWINGTIIPVDGGEHLL